MWLMLSFACTRETVDILPGNMADGEIEVLLSHDSSPQTKLASEFAVPEIGSLKVEIFKIADDGHVRLYKDTYANTLGKKIPLNCADYRLLASHGDSLGAGFDKAYFSGISDFTLAPQESEVIEAVVKVSNVRVSVEYGENVSYDYPEFYAVVKSLTKGGKKRSLKFYQDETRAGFVPLGQIALELYARVDGEWKYFSSEPVEAKPGDDINFKVETKRLESEVGFNVTVQQLDEQVKVFELTEDIYPADSPAVDANGFGGSIVVTEGDEPREDLKLDIVADGQILECWLNVESDYLAQLGVPSTVNLADQDMQPEIKAALESVGLRWMTTMQDRKYAYVDFSGLTRYLASVSCDPDNMFDATFSIDLVDSRHGVEGSEHQGTVQSAQMTFVQGVPAPEILVKGFGGATMEVMEAVETECDDLKAEFVAKGKIAKCVLTIDSPYLAAAGVPQSVDLVTVDESMKTLLNSVGITWSDDLAGGVYAEVDFTGVADYMENSMYRASNGFDFADFSISIENALYKEGNIKDASSSVGQFAYVIPSAPSATDNYAAIDVRAKRLNNYSTILAEGNFNAWSMQFSTDGKTWTNMPAVLNGSTLLCQEATGLSSTASAGVTHSVRAIYHNNTDITYPLSSFTTEAAAQVPNADFEIWQIADYEYYLDKVTFAGGGYYTSRKWYLPWTSDSNRYWDVNSRKTMPGNTTPKEQDFKVFPATSYSTDTPDGSGKSAQMVGVYVSNMATSSSDGDGLTGTLGGLLGGVTQTMASAAGEIFLGKADNAGNHSSEGCAFGSRPDKLKFSYKYTSKNSEKYLVTVWLKDAEENIIAEAQAEGGEASSWTSAEIPLTYYEADVRPTQIYICFRAASCADSDVYHDRNVTIEMAGSNFKGHIGSIFKVDNVELIYQ